MRFAPVDVIDGGHRENGIGIDTCGKPRPTFSNRGAASNSGGTQQIQIAAARDDVLLIRRHVTNSNESHQGERRNGRIG
jgi:hypothetical protein